MNKLYRNILIIAVILASVAVTAAFFIKKKTAQLSPQTEVEFSGQGVLIKMVYCQPSKKGRLIFGSEEDGALQPFGKYWRLGANEATIIEINNNLILNGQVLAKGRYSVYAIPGKETWEIGINKVANRWGASEPDYSQDLFVTEILAKNVKESKERFTIYLTKNQIVFWWDTTKAVLPYKVIK